MTTTMVKGIKPAMPPYISIPTIQRVCNFSGDRSGKGPRWRGVF